MDAYLKQYSNSSERDCCLLLHIKLQIFLGVKTAHKISLFNFMPEKQSEKAKANVVYLENLSQFVNWHENL